MQWHLPRTQGGRRCTWNRFHRCMEGFPRADHIMARRRTSLRVAQGTQRRVGRHACSGWARCARRGPRPGRRARAVGVVGIIDPARIIPKYGITALQHAKPGKGSKAGTTVYHQYLNNDALYARATGGRDMQANGLTAHRATDDAKAERTWLKRLPELTAIMFGAEKKPCGVTMAQYRAYHDQYDRNAAFLARRG